MARCPNRIELHRLNAVQLPGVRKLEGKNHVRFSLGLESIAYFSKQTYMTSIVEPYYSYIGFTETLTDPHLTKYSRIDAMNWACKLEVADCVQKAQSQYSALMAQPNNIMG